MNKIYPPKLQKGDQVRVIAPARSKSLSWINNEEVTSQAEKELQRLGLEVTFGKNVYKTDRFDSATVEQRLSDLHDAFRDSQVKLILTVIGGYNSNQLLSHIDYELIKNNPKILCGYSDITVLANAIYAQTGVVTYSGPHYFTFADCGQETISYTRQYFEKAFFSEDSYRVENSTVWSDHDSNFVSQTHHNNGYWLINPGQAEGTSIGGNQSTFNLLQGTKYMPSLEGSILFLEYFFATSIPTFERELQSILHQPGFSKVKGLVLGRFKSGLGMTQDILQAFVGSKPELKDMPILANVDFGHTYPMITFPIGGVVRMKVSKDSTKLEVVEH